MIKFSGSMLIFISLSWFGPSLPVFCDIEDDVISTNKWVAGRFDWLAEKLDLWLADDSFTDKPNRTSVRVINRVIWQEDTQDISFEPRFAVKLDLPHTQKKWQLAFTSFDDNRADEGIQRSRPRLEPEEEAFGTFLTIVQDIGKVKTEFEPRFQFSDEFESRYRFKLSSKASVENLEIKPELELFATTRDGTGQFFALNLEYQATPTTLLTWLNEQQYTDGNNTLEVNEGLQIDVAHTERVLMRYQWLTQADNRPRFAATRHTLSAGASYALLKNVLHLHLTPIVYWERQRSFHRLFAVDAAIEFIF